MNPTQQKFAVLTVFTDMQYKLVAMVPENSSGQVTLSKEGLHVANEKGFRMARSSYGCSVGGWYWEAKIVALEKTEKVAPSKPSNPRVLKLLNPTGGLVGRPREQNSKRQVI